MTSAGEDKNRPDALDDARRTGLALALGFLTPDDVQAAGTLAATLQLIDISASLRLDDSPADFQRQLNDYALYLQSVHIGLTLGMGAAVRSLAHRWQQCDPGADPSAVVRELIILNAKLDDED